MTFPWHMAHGMSSHSTGPPFSIQLVLPFNLSPNSGQCVDKVSRGPLDAIFMKGPVRGLLVENVDNKYHLRWR